MARVLYISYDGVLEPLGQSQVLQYLVRLAASHHVVLLSYEKPGDWGHVASRERVRREILDAGIIWYPLRYHKTPTGPATAFDILQGTVAALFLVLRYRIGIIHSRSYVPSVIALVLKGVFRRRFIFDMRGFWADERVESGLWPANSRLYRTAKWFERHFLQSADVVVSLTHAAVRVMRQFPYLMKTEKRFEVIPTCTNLARFRPIPSATQHSGLTIGYVGSVSLWYLFDESLRFFNEIHRLRADARLLIINRSDHALIRDRLARYGIADTTVELKAVEYPMVPEEINRMDAAVFFIKPVFSKTASAATKLGELLGCGVPCAVNSGVGDQAEVIRTHQAGVVVDDFSDKAIADAARELLLLLEDLQTSPRCEAAARLHFSLDTGVAAYDALYTELSGKRMRP